MALQTPSGFGPACVFALRKALLTRGASCPSLVKACCAPPLEPWRTWFAAHHLDWPEPADGSQFNDIGLMCNATGMGVALVRLKLGAQWLEHGSLVCLYERNVPSPHAHYLCWRIGMMGRWKCATFADWLRKSVG